ncbi:pyridoxine/pyridoxamine 5'-phosphate oxidase [Microterricola viridarii]|uniref:Pyridoxamine 5'-phosphate oxidase n=1 Tax=Microterricola viridarii TaxID=412690 RepID=A0A1H1RGD0_9MICO|nr:pyridoxamine 5'-phosphate oxidase family protein [Microterricola viridarii]SDS34755.1 pyridoxamine 5'-phosphate oxidase [Microterricola viridarii]
MNTTRTHTSIGPWLRAQPALAGTPPTLDRAQIPLDPVDLFVSWIREAASAGVPEPHAATLATVDEDGIPDARTLILKDVGPRGWAFAGQRSSSKGAQLAAHPAAALNFWWQPIARAVRVRGAVQEASRADSEADLAARSAPAREGIPSGDWTLWRIEPVRVEFWQGAPDRRHARIVYLSDGRSWERSFSGGDGA